MHDKLTYGMQYASFNSWVSPKFTIHKQHQHCINVRLYSFFLSLHVNNSDWSSIKLLLTQINRWILFRFVVFRLPKSPLLQFVFLWNIIYTWSKVDGYLDQKGVPLINNFTTALYIKSQRLHGEGNRNR